MLKSFKTEIRPTEEQKMKIHRTIGTCRFMYNFYLAHNKALYVAGKPFMTAKSFSVWLNNEFLSANPDYAWIKDASSKAVKKSLEDACTAFTRFFKKQAGFPSFKKKHKSDVKMYFVRNNPKDCLCKRHRIKIPTLGWVKLKEKGYLPTSRHGLTIKSSTVSIKAGRYYVSVLVDMPDAHTAPCSIGPGIGIDLGIKELAILSDGSIYPNINKSPRMYKLERRLKREQRRLSRKQEVQKKHKSPGRKNIRKQIRKLQKLYTRMDAIRTDHINKAIVRTVKAKPSFIAVEDLNVSGMMKNRHLSRAIASQKLYEFRSKLTSKCKENDIELRIVDRFYPSSRICSRCGHMKQSLKLSERTYHCDACGWEADRDFNASVNIRDAKIYKTA